MPAAPGSSVIQLAMSPERYLKLKLLARYAGLSVRAYVTSMLIRHLDATEPEAPQVMVAKPVESMEPKL